MGAAYSSNVSKQSQVSRTEISTDIQQRGNVNSVASNSIVQICGDITGNGGTCPQGSQLENRCCPKDTTKDCQWTLGDCKNTETFDDSQCKNKKDGTVTLPEADTKGCIMKNVKQQISSEQVQKAVQKAVLKTVSKTNLNQALQQMAKATVSNFNAFQMSQAISNSNQQLSMQTKVSNNIAQTCGSSSTQSNSVYQQCGSVKGAQGCIIENLTQSLESKATQECLQNATVNNSVMQEARQKAEQISVAKAIGVNLFSGAVLLGLLAFLGIIVLAPVISGVAEGNNRAKALQSGVDPGMPKTKVILLIGAALLVIAGAVLWIIMAQRDVGASEQEVKAGYLVPGYKQEQPLATIFPDTTYFPDFDYNQWTKYMDTVRSTCKGKDGTVDEDCFQKKTTFDAYCNTLNKNTCLSDPLGKQICGWEGGGANPTCTAVSGMLGKIRVTKDEVNPQDLLNQCQEARNKFYDSNGKEGYDCVGWRWKRKPGFPSNLKVNRGKRETDGWFADWISGSSDKTCDRVKCQQSGYNPTDPACQNCCTKGKWPVVTDLCGALKSADCKGSKFYPQSGITQCALNCQWDAEKGCQGKKKTCPDSDCEDYRCKNFYCTACDDNIPKGVGFTLERREGQPNPKAPDGNGTGGIGKPLTNDKITDQSAYRCMGTSESVASAYVTGPTNYGTIVAVGLLALAVLAALIALTLKGKAISIEKA